MLAAFLSALTLLITAMTVVPLLPIAHGLVRLFDFPRLQIIAAAIVLMPLTGVFLPIFPTAAVLLGIQVVVLCAQAAVCRRFTPIWPMQSQQFSGRTDESSVVRIIAANVKMSNRSYPKLNSLVRKQNPHIALLMEVDQSWFDAIERLREQFPFRVERPQDNSYGMVILSQFPLEDTEVRCLLIEGVPSVRTTVVLPDGRRFRLHALHPEPPVPYEDTVGRDGELILTARDVASDPMPAIVAGDMNDVAWSRTTRRFQRLSGLLDPRVGRGFFNSFDARNPLLRWPLDHLFHDARFELVHLARLPTIDSDHFPMLFELALTNRDVVGNRLDPPDSDDIEEAEEELEEASRLQRQPVGTDWET